MASLTKYAGTISQTTGGKYRTFSDLNNLKNNVEGSWANSNGNIKGKSSSPNRPSTLSFTNFGFNLPTGAEVSKIVITYRHKKTGSLSIGAPTISLLGIGGFSSKAVAPKTSMETHTKSFYADGSKNNNLITPTTNKVTRSTVNSSSFGVKVNYPANTNSSEGTMSISYVRVTVEYKVPSYALTLKKAGGSGYNEESYTVEASISNTNLTGYNPTCTLTAPTGFSFTDFSGSGEYTKVSPTVIIWNPQFTSKVPSSTASFKFDVDVTYPSGQSSYTGTFTLSESLYSSSKSLSATITDRPSGEGTDVDPDEPLPDGGTAGVEPETIVEVVSGNEFKLDLTNLINSTIPDTTAYYKYTLLFYNAHSDNISYDGNYNAKGMLSSTTALIEFRNPNMVSGYPTDFPINGNWSMTDKGMHQIDIIRTSYGSTSTEIRVATFYINVLPQETDLTVPFFTILEPSEEEYNRLGSGYTYIAQADIKHTTTDTIGRDWYKNNRIGIFNNRLKPLFEDFGVTGNSKLSYWYWNTNYGTGSVGDDGTTFTATSTREYLTASATLTSPATSSTYIYDFPLTVEFDIVSYEDPTGVTDYSRVRVYNSANSKNANWSIKDYGVGHFKIVCTEGSQKLYYNGVEQSRSFTFTPTTAWNVSFQTKGHIKYKNFKIYDDSIDIDNLSPQQIYENAEYWSKATGGLNEYNSVECGFTYNENYPLYVIMTGDYPEATSYGYDIGTIKHTEPSIIEKPVYNGRERNGTYPVPIQALLDGEDIATLQLAKDQTSQGVVLYDFPVDETISTNDKLAIRGLQVRANIEATDNLVIQAKLHSPNGEVGNRSILVDSQDEEIVIGGLGDLWGFTTLQMTHLELWQLELSVANILSQSDSSILFNNVEIIFYLETVEKQEITIKVEDEDIAYYGAFIETVKIPEGLNTNTSFLSIDGTDTNDAYRQNIREKTITIEFNLSNCELQTSTDMLRQLTKLFVNEKDQYNRPIPKRIQFSHYPNDYFEYIMEEPFDVNTEITDYQIKAQLTVPSGTSYSLYDTVTNTTGNANGLAAVNPIITLRPSDVNIQVTETNTGQVFQIAYTGDWNDHTVEIDCEDRKVYLIKGEDERIDISKYADYNSDWFRLDGEYEFSSVNCTILSVIFNERW